MHLTLLLCGLSLAWGLRLLKLSANGTCQQRWQRALGQFLFPPLLLLMTAAALVGMGPQGQMVRWWEGWFSYLLAAGFLGWAAALAIKLLRDGKRSLLQVRTYPQLDLRGRAGRLLPTPIPFIAQVGFWQSELVVSQGLIDTFGDDHVEAVLTHEQAHAHYRDTFWFFWLGWLRRVTVWLPQTEALWQELLLLRERRADRWATQTVDTLLLAESLLQMVSAPELYSENFCAAFSSAAPRDRLAERIEALLSEPELAQSSRPWMWVWLLLALLPLTVVPFHY